ncbi:MAG: hypothetical protein VX278_01345 [Myxococcota bacterium]|nr:hypothetical protein [Myxococcota bacterium]
MRSNRGNSSFSGTTLLAIVLIIGAIAYLYLPMYWDYWSMRSIVRESAVEWRRNSNVNARQAKEMMVRDMERKNISTDVGDNDCRYRESRKTLSVSCSWTGTSNVPLIDHTLTQDFTVDLTVDANGEIESW